MTKIKSIKVLSIVSAVVVSVAMLLNVAFAQSNSEEVAKIRAKLQTMIPVATEADIQATDIDGIYRLDIQGNYAFVHVRGDYVLIGDLLDTKNQVNVGEQAKSERMAKAIGEFPLSKMIVFEPQQSKRYITVVTDVDCGWCRKLHTEVPSLNEAGVAVRYVAWPHAGVGSASYKKFVSVWCNSDFFRCRLAPDHLRRNCYSG